MPRLVITITAMAVLTACASLPPTAAGLPAGFTNDVTFQVPGQPMALRWLPDGSGRMLILDRLGSLFIGDPATRE